MLPKRLFTWLRDLPSQCVTCHRCGVDGTWGSSDCPERVTVQSERLSRASDCPECSRFLSGVGEEEANLELWEVGMPPPSVPTASAHVGSAKVFEVCVL